MAQALARQGDRPALSEPLPVPRNVEELVTERLGGLSQGARELVLAAAALSRPTTSVLERAAQPGGDVGAALIEAEEAGVLVLDQERVRFAHPLLASVVLGASSQERRRQLHERLADVVEDPEERARHLASSATVPTDTVATEIESAAAGAARRGAHRAAAELYAASARLTPPDDREALARRRLGEATALLAVGDMTAAKAGAEEAALSDVPGTRAQALLLLSEIQWVMGSFGAASEHARAALEATTDEDVLARIYPRLVYYHVAHDPPGAVAHADAALEAIDQERYPAAAASVSIDRFWAGIMLGEPPRLGLFAQWRDLEARAGDEERKNVIPLIYFHSVDDFDEARARHAVEDEWYRVHGEEDWRAERQAHVSYAEFRAGRWDEAERLVEEACAVIARVEQPGPWTMAFRLRSFVDAGRGRVALARETLVPLIDQARGSGRFWWEALLLSALAFVEYTAGDHAAVDRAVMRMRECQEAAGQREMLPDRSEPIHVESLVALDEPERAREELERLEERGRVFPRLWITATLPRARALVLAAEGDVGGALATLDELDLEAASRLPFDLALTHLVRGRLHRRARQRGAAADAFGRALELFAELGAPTWEERARSELERVGLRRSTKELTATELRVAELAAQGLTNREVASRAFMSPKTVEANLARVYRKLGIRSRAELGARIRAEPASSTEAGVPSAAGSRMLTTVLFTDLVGSTAQALTLGDTAWAALLGRHNETVRRELARFSGEEIDTAGDGFLALFDAPAQAIRCAIAIQRQLGGLGLAVRAGIHTGEVERQPGDKPRGIAIHACARIMSLAGGGEVLVSETSRDLVAGSGIRFEDRGEHELRGLEGMRRVYAVDGASAQT
jgi:class 3 adenylate cyclase